jgi:hypothetical protein
VQERFEGLIRSRKGKKQTILWPKEKRRKITNNDLNNITQKTKDLVYLPFVRMRIISK